MVATETDRQEAYVLTSNFRNRQTSINLGLNLAIQIAGPTAQEVHHARTHASPRRIHPARHPEGLAPNTPVSALFADGPIEVRVMSQKASTVRIGIDAPKDLDILRSELVQ